MGFSSASDDKTAASPFREARAVETWDTWFRWREAGQLRDRTIEDTWQRVASALTARAARPPHYKHSLVEAFAQWQLLLDERLLMHAGTAAEPRGGDLHAALNAASFVRTGVTGHAHFDQARFEAVAALAVQALDDAAGPAADAPGPPTCTRVGIIGLGDALALLGIEYDSDAGRRQAADIAKALAQGSLAGSITLARERGAHARCGKAWHARARQRGYRPDLVEAADAHGLRQGLHTAITSQPRLALFANAASDALDPAPAADPDEKSDASGKSIPIPPHRSAPVGVTAQLQLRAAIQPLIDEPIVYPLSIDHEPDASDIQAWKEHARRLDLAPPTWRFAMRQGISHPATGARGA